MIQKSLVYIYATHPRRTFVGCGAFVEGGYIATCRHVWTMATEKDGAVSDRVELIFPHFMDVDDPPIVVHLASACDLKPGRRPDLVLLSPSTVPPGVVALQPATDEMRETGTAFAHAGLPGQISGAIDGIGEVTIDGTLAVGTGSDGRRQFTGSNPTGFWLERGSSGSPVFLVHGQQLAGILSLSTLGANAGKTHLHVAHVVPGTTIRDHLIALQALPVAEERHIPVADLRDILERLGAQDVAVANIPRLLREFVDASQAHGREPPAASKDVDIADIVERSRSLVQDLKPSEALCVLNARIAEENEAWARRLISLLKEQAEVQRIVFDHSGRLASLKEVARIDASDVQAWTEIGDVHVLLGNSKDAQESYHRARSTAMAVHDERNLLVCHIKIGDVLRAQGDGPGALAAYQAGLEIALSLAQRDPANTQWQRDLSINHSKIGDVLRAQGDGARALAAYHAALDIARGLALRDPGNTEWQRDLSVSHDKIGDVLRVQGNGARALAAYQAGLDITWNLTRRDPTNTDWQHGLLVSQSRIGDVLLAQGNGAEALSAYQAALDIARSLARLDPVNTEWQRGLLVCHIKIGDILRAQGDGPGALATYQAGLEIALSLARRDPPNTDWQRDLWVCHCKIGDVLVAQGDGAGTLAAYRAGLEIALSLAQRDPANTQWQHDLSINHSKIGNVLLAQGNNAGALSAYQAALDIARSLALRDPVNTEWQRGLSVSHGEIGNVLRVQGDDAGALVAYQAGLDISRSLAQRDPANTGRQRDMWVSHIKIGDVLLAERDSTGALATYRAGLDIAMSLTQRDPSNTEWQGDLSANYNKIGDVLRAQDQDARALAAYQSAMDIAQSLARRDPFNTEWQRDLMISNVKLSEAAPTGKRAYLERALQIVRDLHRTKRLAPVDTWMLGELARRLSDLPVE